jgi:cathepsin B
MQAIAALNSQKLSWTAGYNAFFAGFDEQRRKDYMGTKMHDKGRKALPVKTYTDAEVAATQLPASFDARQKWGECIQPIANQASCGSCWAFGAVGAGTFATHTHTHTLSL